MEALKLVRRLVYYLLYFVLVVTFFYFVSDAALSFFHEGAWPLTEERVLNNVLLPYLYAFLSLGVALLIQFTFIKKPGPLFERKVYAWALVVVFLFHLAITAIVLIVGGVSVKEGMPSIALLIIPSLPLLTLAIGELFYAGIVLFGIRKEEKIQKDSISAHENNEIASTHDYNE